jgi:hypothetical protein
MKVIRVTSAAAVVLLLGAMTPAWAQHEGGEKQGEKQPEQHAQQPQRAAPQQHAAQPKAQQEQPRAAQPRQQEQPRAAQPRQQEQPRAAQPRQQEQPRAAQPRQQEQPRAQQPAAQQNKGQTQQARQSPQAQPQRTQQQARSWQQQKGWTQGGGWQGHATFAQDRSQSWSTDHRTWGQRGGYGGYFIPQAQFDASFGGGHFFRLGALPGLYLGYPQFSYGGFSFLMVDPWPGDWSGNWYSSDDVYIDYNDGYYLHDRLHPQEAIAITIRL